MAAEEEKPKETAKAVEAPKEEESTATFEPVVKLEEVEVKSGEEEEVRVSSVCGLCRCLENDEERNMDSKMF